MKKYLCRDKYGRSFLSILDWLDSEKLEMKVNIVPSSIFKSQQAQHRWHNGFVICCLSGRVRNWIEGTVYFWNY